MMAQQMQQGQGAQQLVVCPSCGAKNQVNVKFCGGCGGSLAPPAKVTCPNCKAEVPANLKFCGECGKPMVASEVNCPKCKAKNATGTKFCGNCGEKLA
jgi:predicted amidophosphoribosyltransferase